MEITNNIKYIGCDDTDLDLFESQYKVPNGVSYNSYLILDEKVAVLDTIDHRKSEEWFKNLENNLNGRDVDYLIVSHLEPDHSANIKALCDKYPNAKLVLSKKALDMLPQFFQIANLDSRAIVVKEGDTLSLGEHTLTFIMAPMVHWPEVMVEYESKEKILFSADGFGKFGALACDEPWVDEARRYYINIVGKYGGPVAALLKKAQGLDIKMICPLHGPILKENLGYYLDLYSKWATYTPECDGVLVVSASIHGYTKDIALNFYNELKNNNVNASFVDITRSDMSSAVSLAFKYSKRVLACSTYHSKMVSPMEDFLNRLSSKGYQKRTVGLIENGSWAPMAKKCVTELLGNMKDVTILDQTVTVKTTLNDESKGALIALLDSIKNS